MIIIPRKPSSIGAALMSSAKGRGIKWKPGGSFHPPSSTFSAYDLLAASTWEDPGKSTCGSIAQKVGDAFLRVRDSTRPIFFFLIMDFNSALNVRLLPE